MLNLTLKIAHKTKNKINISGVPDGLNLLRYLSMIKYLLNKVIDFVVALIITTFKFEKSQSSLRLISTRLTSFISN